MSKPVPNDTVVNSASDDLKSWVMVALTLALLLLYAAALSGKLRPLTDMSMVARLEPIIFVIIGYYFGRLPTQQNEKTLRDELLRQTQRADVAAQGKAQVENSHESLEEKLKNAIAVLNLTPPEKSAENSNNEPQWRHCVATALTILNS